MGGIFLSFLRGRTTRLVAGRGDKKPNGSLLLNRHKTCVTIEDVLKLPTLVTTAALWLIASQATVALAQTLELGGRAGGGAFGVSSGGASGSAQLGVEACVLCGGRFALFGEYSHWASVAGNGFSDRVHSADLAGGGLRIQWSRLVRPFLDIGVVGGRDRHESGRGGAIGGIVVGGGVRLPLGALWYLRPQVRVYGLSPHTLEGLDAHWAIGASLGVGYRF